MKRPLDRLEVSGKNVRLMGAGRIGDAKVHPLRGGLPADLVHAIEKLPFPHFAVKAGYSPANPY